MSRLRNVLSVLAVAMLLFGMMASDASAQRRNERELRDIVRNLSSKVDDFQYTLDYRLRSSSADDDEISVAMASLQDLQRKIGDFQLNLDQRRENRDDVNAIINSARSVDQFLTTHPQNQHISNEWSSVRTLIDRLAANYGVSGGWSNSGSSYPSTRSGSGSASRVPGSSRRTNAPATRANTSGLVGTYALDRTRSEPVDQVITETNVDQTQRQDLEQKLESPEQLAIDIRGNEVTLASSKAPPISFIADGRDKTEQDSSGRSVRVRATLQGQQLTVSSVGGENDYTVIFTAQDNGRTLKVTRRITTDYLNQTVLIDSIYTRTDTVARLGIMNSGQNMSQGTNNSGDNGAYSDNDSGNVRNTGNTGYRNLPATVPGRTGNYIVPNGAIITGLLESTIDTKVSQNNDRFRLTVQSPNEFRGAVIEGYLSGIGRSGRISGSSNVTFNFERITLRNGQSYDFAGFLQGIKDQNGKVVKVDAEGTAKGDSQTRETVKRGGVGAGIGALIGAIAGGGKGAAIGAIIGGGAGAGSVVYQGRDDVQLMQGSMITIQSSSPIRRDQPVIDN